MTIPKIASALCADSFRECARKIFPPWIEDADDSAVRDAYKQVVTLRRQRDELTGIWPGKKDELQKQFNDSVMTLANDLYAQLYDLTA